MRAQPPTPVFLLGFLLGVPRTEEPGGPQSKGSQKVGYDGSNLSMLAEHVGQKFEGKKKR